jgi:hypothetical protein
MLAEYYEARGWENGVVPEGKLKELEILWLESLLARIVFECGGSEKSRSRFFMSCSHRENVFTFWLECGIVLKYYTIYLMEMFLPLDICIFSGPSLQTS